MSLHKLTIGKDAPEIFNVVVEIPKGSHNKYEFDEETGLIKLDRVLFSPMHYPLDYGFIPETRSEDGDHLDAMIIGAGRIGVGAASRPDKSESPSAVNDDASCRGNAILSAAHSHGTARHRDNRRS